MADPHVECYNRAIDLLQLSKFPEAKQALEEALVEKPDDIESWRLLAVVLEALGEKEAAERAQARIEDLGGISEADKLMDQAAKAAQEGKGGVAVSLYEDVLELEPENGHAWLAYALILMEEKYPKDAQDASEKAVQFLPDEGAAWYARGRILRMLGDFSDAKEALSKSVELEANFPLARYELGMIQAKDGELDEAIASFQKLTELTPDDPQVQQVLQDLLAAKQGGAS